MEGRIREFLVQEPDAGGIKRKSNSEVKVRTKKIRQQEDGKMKKENWEEKRVKKEAAAADKMANKIFHVAAECTNCKCLKEEL